ncbi:hypothetical protein [Nocardia crassostreae]|uniref:hypothetical protein n=1 Tax=Nocardia crassostreae TaxID=53428 RepID=UPI000A597834|nr:hypothetical protein [Nocardia crassostreae]
MTAVRRRTRTLLIVAAAMLLSLAAAAPPAAAEPAPPDPTYPFAELAQLLSGTDHDLRAPGMVDYFVRAGVVQNLANAGIPFRSLLDPATWTGPDAQQRQLVAAQRIFDALVRTPPLGLGLPSHPDYLPNWSHDGNFWRNAADAALDDDYDNPAAQEATFRYPCIQPNGDVLYETEDGACVAHDTPGAVFKLGTVRKFTIINNRGIPLRAKIFLPEGAERSGERYPVTVMAPGATEKQSDVSMYTLSAVREGFIGITFEESGNGVGEGSLPDMWFPQFKFELCRTPGGCRDVKDVMRWLTRTPITPIVDVHGDELANLAQGEVPKFHRYDPAYGADNVENPWYDLMDTDHINLWGQSYGSVAISNYGYWQGKGVGIDGQPLPKVSSIVALSGFSYTTADIPIQFQTADFDIPVPAAFAVTNTPNGIVDATDGPIGNKDLYDYLRGERRGDSPLMFLTYEGGSHGDSINWPGVPRNVISPWLSTSYAVDWFGCYGRADVDQSACDALRQPRQGLSRAFATEYSPQGPAGPSLCVTVPDRATLIQAVYRPADFIQNNWGTAEYDCTPQN